MRGFFWALLTALSLIFVNVPSGARAQDLTLVMFDEAGCPWCARWDREIGPIYPKTTEGKRAPLRQTDISDQPRDGSLVARVRFTPTFVLLSEGQEVGRIEGYPGEDFFWMLLGQMLADLPPPSDTINDAAATKEP